LGERGYGTPTPKRTRKRGHDLPQSHGATTEPAFASHEAAEKDLDELLARLDVGIAQEQKKIDALLSRLRTTLIAA